MAGDIHGADDDGVIASINMIPFIDIALVLLIIFLVTSSYIVHEAIQVNLPGAASGSDVTPSTVGIVIDETGAYWLNGESVSREALSAGIRAEVDADESVQAIITGDRGVDYGRIIDVLDLVIQNGVRSYALNVERRPAEVRSDP